MITGSNLFGPITQLGYLTDDIEATARAWTDMLGIGPWTLMQSVTMHATMNGEDSDIEIDVALAYKDDVQIELIKPLNDAPSPYQEFVKAGIWGLHHVQFETDDMEASIEDARNAGLEPVCKINQGGGVFTYLKGPGVWFELIQTGPELLGFYEMIKSRSKGWDHKNLLDTVEL